MPKSRSQKSKGVVQRIKDAISKREDPKDKRSRVGSGGRKRADRAMDAVDRMQTGKKK